MVLPDTVVDLTHVADVELVNNSSDAASKVYLSGSLEVHDVMLELRVGVDLRCELVFILGVGSFETTNFAGGGAMRSHDG